MAETEKVEITINRDDNLYQFREVWLNNGINSPKRWYIVKIVGDFAWLSDTKNKETFNGARSTFKILHKDAYYTDQVEAIRGQIDQINKVGLERSDAYRMLDLLLKERMKGVENGK